jgi:hypothetical protein
MGARHDHGELEAYLRVLAGREPATSFLELRHRVAPGTLAAEFFAVHDVTAAVVAIDRHAAVTDVYVGCAPRCRRAGTKRDIARVWVLWAECDGPEAAAAAQAHDPAPAIVIGRAQGRTCMRTGR